MMKPRKSSRFVSLVLSAVMVLAMLPAMSGTAEAAGGIVTRTTPLDLTADANISYVATDDSTKTANPARTSITDTKEGWSWNKGTKTFKLSGANIDCSGNAAESKNVFGVMLPSECRIVLETGTTNIVKAGDAIGWSSTGIEIKGGASISGNGTLNVTSGGSEQSASCGILGSTYASDTLSFSDATLIVTTAKAKTGCGIAANLDVKSGTITAIGNGTGAAQGIEGTRMNISGGDVTAIGNTNGNYSGYGVYLLETLKMTGGTLSASGKYYAIFLETGPITAAGATATGSRDNFLSGDSTNLRQKSEAAPVIIRFGPPPPPVFKVDYNIAGGSGSRLERSLNTVVTDAAGGVTDADKAGGNSVSLKLTVAEKTAVDEKIEGVKQGDSVQYYDVTVQKTVTTQEGASTITNLTSIPMPVRAIIPVPADIQGKTSYTVYRIHGGVADKIPHDPTAPEFYTVNPGGTSLTLNVNKFSTYAVITSNKALTGDATFGDAKNPKNSAVDVQGKVIEGNFGVYKLDVSWGAMKFDYNAQGKVWNPDTHAYVAGAVKKGWIDQSFIAPNNKITVANHSNGDVTLSYTATADAILAGATMTVRANNSLSSVLAENLLLGKVAAESNMTAPTVDAYVWLTGEPANLKSATYTKAGVITITAEPDTAGGLTPKNP